jgi:hypothetical protein
MSPPFDATGLAQPEGGGLLFIENRELGNKKITSSDIRRSDIHKRNLVKIQYEHQ